VIIHLLSGIRREVFGIANSFAASISSDCAKLYQLFNVWWQRARARYFRGDDARGWASVGAQAIGHHVG